MALISTVLVEAPIWGDYVFTRTLDFSELPGPMGTSYNGWPGYIGNEAGAQQLFAGWWEAGMKLVEAMPIELGVRHCSTTGGHRQPYRCCVTFILLNV